jgi:hypothetical protein
VSSADRSFKEVMDCADKRVSNLDLWALLDKGLEKHKIGIYLFRNRYVWERYGISKLAIKHAKEQRIKRIKRPLTVVQQVVLDIDSLI